MTANMNSKRAAWALMAVRQFGAHCGNDGDEEAFQDLLTDMVHLCDAMGLGWKLATLNAEANHEEEIDEDGVRADMPSVLAIIEEGV